MEHSCRFIFIVPASHRSFRPLAATHPLVPPTWWKPSSNTAYSKADGWASSASCVAILGEEADMTLYLNTQNTFTSESITSQS